MLLAALIASSVTAATARCRKQYPWDADAADEPAKPENDVQKFYAVEVTASRYGRDCRQLSPPRKPGKDCLAELDYPPGLRERLLGPLLAALSSVVPCHLCTFHFVADR